MTKKINIPKNILKNLYLNQKLSAYQVAKKFNCDPTVIQKRLKRYGIKIRYPKKRIDVPKDKLQNLYWNKKLSSYKIAKLLRIGRTTIYSKLVDYGIRTRPKKIVRISKEKLKELYFDKKLPLSKIAELYNCSNSIILDKMRKYNLNRRNKFEANTIYPKRRFNGDKELKAYMIGFRLGDLNVKSKENTSVVLLKSNTTKKDQYDLIREVYGVYGHFKYKIRNGTYYIWCNLDKSFSFLVPKEDMIESWILEDNKFFFAFLGGYTEAEGNISISQGRARFRIRSYDKNLLFHLYKKLNFLGINTKFGVAYKKGVRYGRTYNRDCWGIFVNSKESLSKLFKFLKPYVKHKKRSSDLLFAEKNIVERIKKYKVKS